MVLSLRVIFLEKHMKTPPPIFFFCLSESGLPFSFFVELDFIVRNSPCLMSCLNCIYVKNLDFIIYLEGQSACKLNWWSSLNPNDMVIGKDLFALIQETFLPWTLPRLSQEMSCVYSRCGEWLAHLYSESEVSGRAG